MTEPKLTAKQIADKKAADKKAADQKAADLKAIEQEAQEIEKKTIVGKMGIETIKTAFVESAESLKKTTDKLFRDAIKERDIKDPAQVSKKDILGTGGKRAECHKVANARLSGLNEAELVAMQLFRPDLSIDQLLRFTRENKGYLRTMACMIAQKRQASYIDLSRVNAASKAIDPSISDTLKGVNSINGMMKVLEKMHRTGSTVYRAFDVKEALGHEGFTQGNNHTKLFNDNGFCDYRIKSSVGGFECRGFKMDHPFIVALLKSQNIIKE